MFWESASFELGETFFSISFIIMNIINLVVFLINTRGSYSWRYAWNEKWLMCLPSFSLDSLVHLLIESWICVKLQVLVRIFPVVPQITTIFSFSLRVTRNNIYKVKVCVRNLGQNSLSHSESVYFSFVACFKML